MARKLIIPPLDKEQICRLFGCTMQQLNEQYSANAAVLWQMHDKSIKIGKKVNGYTADQLAEMADKHDKLAQA